MRSVLTFVLTLAASASAQATWVVDFERRPGWDFMDVPEAVAAASPGDRILVRYNSTRVYAAPLIDKPLDLVALTVSGTFGRVALRGLLQIRGIAVGQAVRMRGFEVLHSLTPGWGIDVRDCDGLIHLDSIYEFPAGIVGAMDEFRNCRSLRLHACDLTAKGSPILFQNCAVEASSCSFLAVEGAGVPSPSPLYFGLSADAVRLVDSTLTMNNCAVFGADQTFFLQPTKALDLLRSTVSVGPTCGVYGGYRQNIGYDPFATGTGTIRHDPRAVFGGQAPWNLYIPMIQEWRHETVCTKVERNRTFDAAIVGPPHGFGILALSFPLPTPQPTWLGELGIDPNQISWIAAGALDQRGRAVRTLFCHADVPLEPFYAFQSGWLAPDGTFSLGRPVVFSVGWEPGRTYP